MREVGLGDQAGALIWPDEDGEGVVGLQVFTEADGVRIKTAPEGAGPFQVDDLRQIGAALQRKANELADSKAVEQVLPDTGQEVAPGPGPVRKVWTGECLKVFRESWGTQAALAEELAISVSTLRKLEKGQAPISPDEEAALNRLSSDSKAQ